jgi:DNA-binding MarR family transcriptional regulator/N-acetylglutamate synthase-like GNAT family acetyltransferase
MNLVKKLGKAAFGTRLRLLTDRFLQDGAKVYKLQNVNFEPRWFTLYYLLSKKSPLSISEITTELGYSQPAVTQIANIMVKKGIIKVVKDKTDTRKRMLALSPKGAALLPKLEPIWKGFEDAIAELFSSVGYDVLSIIEKIENELTQKDMLQRVTEKIRQDSVDGVTIFIYCDNYKDSFRRLNYEWLEKYFKVEEEDKKLLLNPMGEIIDKGGEVFFARINGDIVGTAALIKYDDKTYELAKMAVTEKAQGRQIGKKLAEAVITQAKANNADVLFLESNTKLTQAMGLYKKLGFKQVEYNNVSKYARSTIKMELKLK